MLDFDELILLGYHLDKQVITWDEFFVIVVYQFVDEGNRIMKAAQAERAISLKCSKMEE